MILRCRTTQLTAADAARLGSGFSSARAARLEVGRQHLALGLQFEIESLLWGTGTWVLIAVADDELLAAPLCLFEIVDGQVPADWEARRWEDGSFTLWPPSFYGEYYLNDLARKDPQTVADFRRVLVLLGGMDDPG